MKESKYYKKMKSKYKSSDTSWISRMLLSIIVVLISLIITNFDSDIRSKFSSNILEKNINFGSFNKIYNKYIGGKESDDTTLVVGLTNVVDYEEIDGSYKIDIKKNEGIEVLAPGIIVYIGDKEEYLNTVIVQGNDGIDLWYSNISLNGYSLYDYVSKGDILGSSLDNNYVLSILKDGEKMKYEEYFG